MNVGRTGTLGCFDVRKRYTLISPFSNRWSFVHLCPVVPSSASPVGLQSQ